MAISIHTEDTPLGEIHLAADNERLLALALPNISPGEFSARMRARYEKNGLGDSFGDGNRITEMAAKQVVEYLEGRRHIFELPFVLQTTPFQKRVLDAVSRIPYGQTQTYSRIAAEVGSPRAARAVGMANARNPLPLVVPCHRVVASSGLGGYGGGLDMKRRLLDLETSGC